MAKPELGVKRLCPECGTKYYDLNRDPITCPKCGALFGLVAGAQPATAGEETSNEDGDEDEDETTEVVSVDEVAGTVPKNLPGMDEDGEPEDVDDSDGDDDSDDSDDDDIGVDDESNDEDT